jgi:hypothetical protein
MPRAMPSLTASKRPRRKSSRSSRPSDGSDTSRDVIPLDSGRGAADDPSQPWEIIDDGTPQSAATFQPSEGPIPDRHLVEGQLEAIEKQIVQHLQRIQRAFRVAIEDRIKIGKCLAEAKSLCEHGGWSEFIERCGLKERTVQELMQFAQHEQLIAEKLIAEKAHGRALLTVESVRRMISSSKKPASRGRKSGSRDDAQEPPADAGTPGEPDRRCDTTTGSTDGEPTAMTPDPAAAEPGDPTSTTATAGPARKDPCGDEEDTEARQGAPDPDEPSDDEWLDSIPLRGELEPEARETFDKAALLWRRTEQARAQIYEQIGPSREEIGRSPYYHMARNRLRLRLLFGALIKPPDQWTICSKCRGRLTDKLGQMPCSGCDGQGFMLTHEGDDHEADSAE